jgi:hypothetical protein
MGGKAAKHPEMLTEVPCACGCGKLFRRRRHDQKFHPDCAPAQRKKRLRATYLKSRTCPNCGHVIHTPRTKK